MIRMFQGVKLSKPEVNDQYLTFECRVPISKLADNSLIAECAELVRELRVKDSVLDDDAILMIDRAPDHEPETNPAELMSRLRQVDLAVALKEILSDTGPKKEG